MLESSYRGLQGEIAADGPLVNGHEGGHSTLLSGASNAVGLINSGMNAL